MKAKFYLTLLFSFLLFLCFSQQSLNFTLPDGASTNWYSNATTYIRQLEYDFYTQDNNAFHTTNSSNHVAFLITANGYTAHSLKNDDDKNKWEANFSLQNIGRIKSVFSFSNTNSQFKKIKKDLVQQFDFADIEYINDEKGLRQNFIVKQKPSGEGFLRVNIGLNSALEAKIINRSKLIYYTPGNKDNIRLIYEDLKVWDADKNILPAHMELNPVGDVLSLVVDDEQAIYPVTIDPLNKTPEWTTSANGVLPGLLSNLALQVQSLYGYTVASLGDINNDGYDDIAVSAPGMADVITNNGSLLGVGAVFIYLGSASGLSTIPDKVLQPNTAAAGALFGFSIDAGNLTGDGINDIIISAPLDTYQTTARGLLGNVNVNVTAGKVYVYRSEDLFSSSNPAPFLQIRLQGTGIFSTGIAGLLLSNVSAKLLFGFSVAVTNDLNGDGREDIIVGTPAFLGTSLLAVRSGAAFVYYSNNLSTTSPVQLSVPTPTILNLLSLPIANLNGLLYGFSVDGVGDYNNDGKADVVVGAPAGIDLSSLGGIFSGQVLGGSAYVYFGNGSGINTAIGAKLQASSSGLLSNAANLFGYKIKGVRNIAGTRNGNILISAPAGSVLSNVVSGLRLKAGEVHVFKKKTGAISNPVISDQALSSPRSSSLLSLLTGQTLAVSLLYGAGLDNTLDMNCDGYADIIVGEPLSTTVPLIGANITGGAAYIYLGTANGSYNSTPIWTVTPEVSPLLGVNVTSLMGYSVAGARHTQGALQSNRVIAGGPANMLDFGSGLLNLGNTIGTLYNFAFDNNGLGKSYGFNPNLCNFTTLPTTLISFKAKEVDGTVQLNWTSLAEIDFSRYELQRSTDGSAFSTIAVIFSIGSQRNDYSFTDKHPATGKNIYRLKMIDNDATFVYSDNVSVYFTEETNQTVTLIQNPVQDDIQLKLKGLEKGNYSIAVYNSAGELLQTKKSNITAKEQTEIIKRSPKMLAGVYWIILFDANNKKVGTAKALLK